MLTIKETLRKHYDELKGFAILWVVFFHARLGLNGFLYDVQKIGYGGVDVFFFLSGFGLYYSLNRSDTKSFLIRRIKRILPAYLPFCLLWLLVMLPLNHGDLGTNLKIIVGNVSMLGYFFAAPLMINWYVSALVISILMAPLLYACVRKSNNSLILKLALLALCFAFGLMFIGRDQYMAASRLPVFLLGMLFTSSERKGQDKAIHTALILSMLCGFVLLLFVFEKRPQWLYVFGMYWHPFALIVPAMCVEGSRVLELLPDKVCKPFACLGKASFEIFLFDVWFEVLGKKMNLWSSHKAWLLVTLAAIVLGLLYHLLIVKCKKMACKREKLA